MLPKYGQSQIPQSVKSQIHHDIFPRLFSKSHLLATNDYSLTTNPSCLFVLSPSSVVCLPLLLLPPSLSTATTMALRIYSTHHIARASPPKICELLIASILPVLRSLVISGEAGSKAKGRVEGSPQTIHYSPFTNPPPLPLLLHLPRIFFYP